MSSDDEIRAKIEQKAREVGERFAFRPRLSDEDLDRIERQQADPSVPDRWPVEIVTALVAEVRRLRAIEAALVPGAKFTIAKGIPVEIDPDQPVDVVTLRSDEESIDIALAADSAPLARDRARLDAAWAVLIADVLASWPFRLFVRR